MIVYLYFNFKIETVTVNGRYAPYYAALSMFFVTLLIHLFERNLATAKNI